MSMIWRHWSTTDLQTELENIDSDLLNNLEEIIPSIRGDEYDPTELSSKENLVKILMSFTNSSYFSRKENMENCLMRLPERVLDELIDELNTDGKFAIAGDDFQQKVANILKISWKNPVFARCFITFFNLPAHFMPPPPNKVPSHVDIDPISEENPLIITKPFKHLIDYQQQVFRDAGEKLAIPLARFVIQMPTGSGKTRTSMEIIAKYLQMAEEGTIVVWLAHSQELCEQLFQCFIEVWQHLANKPLKAIRCWGKHSIPSAYAKSMFIVCGFQKIHSVIKKQPETLRHISPRVGLIVIDEAHKAVAPTYKNAIQKIKGKNTGIIGLTATPGRLEQEETEEMAEFFFQSKVNIQTENGESEIEMLRNRKVLAEINYVPIRSPLNIQLTAAEKRKLEEVFDFPPGLLKKVASSNVRNIEIITKLRQSCERGRKILFFACSVSHSKFIMSLLVYFGIRAAHVDGSTSEARRNEVIEGFRDGEIQVLCNYGVLTTGFDAPNTDEVFISRPTNSVVLYSQMIGRGLRGPTIGGTKECRISDVRDNITGFETKFEYTTGLSSFVELNTDL